jgi:DNA-binding beta-propeller fold protein YncE/mono/diheme cytochrome c family protein
VKFLTAILILVTPLLTLQRLDARPVALSATADGSRLFVAIEEPASLKVIDGASGKVAATHVLPAAPTGMALSADGSRLFITAGLAPGRLLVIDAGSGAILKDRPAGHSPRSPVVSKDGALVYVCNRFADEVLVIEAASGKITGRFPVLREPIGAVLSKDGAALFVANHLPAGRADTGDISCSISVIDVASGESKETRLPNGSTGIEGIAISHDGTSVYVTHTLARYGLPTTQVDRGWMNTSGVSLIDAEDFRHRATVLLDNIDHGAANPWGVACSTDGARLYVAHAGTHELSVIDRKAMHDRIAKAERGERVTEVSDSAADIGNDLAFLVGIRERHKIPGRGPRAVAPLSGNKCAVACYYSGTLHVVDAENKRGQVTSMEMAKVPSDDMAFKGEALFHDATACFQHWQSCSTCHPGVRTDALNWDLLNDGIGNPKQAKSMLFSMQTPPAMISAVRGDAGVAIRAGFRHIQFAQRPEEDAKAIEAFFNALKPVPSPALVDGKLSAAAERGRKIFESAGCIACHNGEYFTDMQAHNIGTGTGREKTMSWDTPTLRECWRTAPYLHDGRAATLESLFTEHNPNDRHGVTKNLSKEQLADLVEYVRSL